MQKIAVLKEKLFSALTKEKLKEAVLSNTGMVVITLGVIGLLALLHGIRQSGAEKNVDTLAVWGATGASSEVSPVIMPHADLKAPVKTRIADNPNGETHLAHLEEKVELLEKQVNQLRQAALKKPYQLLGVRFDTVSHQWVADLKVENTLYSLTSNQTFVGWRVVRVESTGALIV